MMAFREQLGLLMREQLGSGIKIFAQVLACHDAYHISVLS